MIEDNSNKYDSVEEPRPMTEEENDWLLRISQMAMERLKQDNRWELEGQEFVEAVDKEFTRIVVDQHKAEKQREASTELFRAKNIMLDQDYDRVLSPISTEEFFQMVFVRRGDDESDLPFERVKCRDWEIWHTQWKAQRKSKKVHIDYSQCERRLYNGLILYRGGIKKAAKGKVERGELLSEMDYVHPTNLILLDGDEIEQRTMELIKGKDWALTYPIGWVGKRPTQSNGRLLYGFAIDLDGVGIEQLKNLFHQIGLTVEDLLKSIERGQDWAPHRGKFVMPSPNIIVNSGNGFHLYYLLKTPIRLYESNRALAAKIKRKLIDRVWNFATSELEQKQYQGIYQGYRIPGSLTKFGEVVRAWAFRGVDYYSFDELNLYLSSTKDKERFLSNIEIKQLSGVFDYDPKKVTREEAKRRWPEWYQSVVVEGSRGHWNISRRVYEWFLAQLRVTQADKVQVGHRYNCIRCLAAIAWKCRHDVVERADTRHPRVLPGVTLDELRRDAMSLLGNFDRLTNSEDNHFTEGDIEAALLAYGKNMDRITKKRIEELTGLSMPIPARRNGRKQDAHLKRARVLRDLDRDVPWDSVSGRHTEREDNSYVAAAIRRWQQEHPHNANKSDCARALGYTRKTVAKWWDSTAEASNENIGGTIKDKVALWRKQHPESTNKSDCARALGVTRKTVAKWWQ